MIMPTEDTVRRRTALPWESIDPSDNQASTMSLEDSEMSQTSSGHGEYSADSPIETAIDQDEIDQDEQARDKQSRDEQPQAIAVSPEPPADFEAATVVLERKETGALAVADEDESDDSSTSGFEPSADDGQANDSPTLSYDPAPQRRDGGGWTVAILCMGLGIIAACIIIPQADANRRLVYEREKLRVDLEQIKKQAAVNQEFLKSVESDPQLAERLAQRQMKMIRQGEAVLELRSADGASEAGGASQAAERMSPFLIMNVPPPPAMPPYRPVGGTFADLCRAPHSQLYLLGTGMLMVATGLVLGSSEKP